MKFFTIHLPKIQNWIISSQLSKNIILHLGQKLDSSQKMMSCQLTCNELFGAYMQITNLVVFESFVLIMLVQ